MISRPCYALSIKQPWAALLVVGLKTVEVRKWATRIRGQVYIHAARDPDKRADGWSHLTEQTRQLAELRGVVIGVADLRACVMYRTKAEFSRDSDRHLNPDAWFVTPRLYGFEFRSPKVVTPFPWTGNVRFFTVEVPPSH